MINTNIFIRNFYKRFGKRNYELGLPTTVKIATNVDGSEDKNIEFVDNLDDCDKIVVICREHGSFDMRPNDVLNSYGCPICGIRKLIDDYFIALYGEKNPSCSLACDELWGFNARKTSDIPEDIVYAIKFALDDPYIKTWGDFWRVFYAILDAQEFGKKEKQEEEKREEAKKPKISGCTSRAHAIEVAERIKRIRDEKARKKNDEDSN